jgi:hypothetical protein
MQRINLREVSPAGHELSRATVEGLVGEMSVRDIIRARINAEVAAYNQDPGTIYVGMVQPEDAIRHSDGFRMRTPRPLDAEQLLTAVEEAVGAGVVSFIIGDRTVDDLDVVIDLGTTASITTVMRRPIVARVPADGA